MNANKQNMTVNLDDANLPTHGAVWEAMLEHVLNNASNTELLESCDGEWIKDYVKDNWDIEDVYDEDEIAEYTHKMTGYATESISRLKLKVCSLREQRDKLKMQIDTLKAELAQMKE